jgi:hypothetical protein
MQGQVVSPTPLAHFAVAVRCASVILVLSFDCCGCDTPLQLSASTGTEI